MFSLLILLLLLNFLSRSKQLTLTSIVSVMTKMYFTLSSSLTIVVSIHIFLSWPVIFWSRWHVQIIVITKICWVFCCCDFTSQILNDLFFNCLFRQIHFIWFKINRKIFFLSLFSYLFFISVLNKLSSAFSFYTFPYLYILCFISSKFVYRWSK